MKKHLDHAARWAYITLVKTALSRKRTEGIDTMQVTRFHIDQANSMWKLRKRSDSDLRQIRDRYIKSLPLAQNPYNARDVTALIAAIDEVLANRTA